MTQSQNILMWLRRLTDLDAFKSRLERGSPELPDISVEIAAIRERLPTAILKHYDERRSRGKPAVAPVIGGICGACRLSLPSGKASELRRGDGTLHVCDNCGAILYPDEAGQEGLPPPPSRQRRSKAHSQ